MSAGEIVSMYRCTTMLTMITIALVFTGGVMSASAACPIVCNCKWKGGKQTVECTDRGLITIPEGVNPDSQVLDMSGNNLQVLPRDMFVRAGLLNLQRVYFRNCRIGEIDDNALHGLTNLVELDLSHNLLTSIPSRTFEDVPFLRDVTLAYNPIQKIESHAFRTLPNLVKLDLSRCELKFIAPKAFEGVEQLESLKLYGNRLNELRPRTVETLSRLHGIELHDNPWICDCRLRDAKLWLVDNNIPYPIAPRCRGGPERVANRSFIELDVDDFACKPEILPVSRYVEATTGENATIVCRVGAVPPAKINWFWNGRLLVNQSSFSAHQRVFIFEDGHRDKSSSLVLTNAQETDTGEFFCLAENRAGGAEANFTLHVSLRTAGMATFDTGQIAGLSAVLVILILFILLIVLLLFVRFRRLPFSESKTPNQVETTAVNDPVANNITKPSISQNSDTSFSESTNKIVHNDIKAACNPVQKPPRLTEVPGQYEGNGSIVGVNEGFVEPPTTTANNPDLIKDTRRLGGTGETLPNHKVSHDGLEESELPVDRRPGSGEYSRAVGCDSLYPSGLWGHSQTSLNPSPDLFMRRTTSAGFGFDTSDKTPIIGDGSSFGGVSEDEADYGCKTLPRVHHNGYPPDYGLPIIPPTIDQKLAAVHGHALSPSTSPTSTTPPNAKTLRVWQRGVPVLPPVTALKRVLTSSRNSPDEGYQEGCGTDV